MTYNVLNPSFSYFNIIIIFLSVHSLAADCPDLLWILVGIDHGHPSSIDGAAPAGFKGLLEGLAGTGASRERI